MQGIIALHVDDFIFAGSAKFFAKIVVRLKRVFVVGEPDRRKFSYVGWQVQQPKNGEVLVDQDIFLRHLEDLNKEGLVGTKMEEVSDELQRRFRAVMGSINWLSCNTRPDLSYEVMELFCTFGKATVDDYRKASRLVKKEKEQGLSVKYHRLGEEKELVVLVYGDGAYASFPDISSCAGKLVLVVGEEGKCAPLAWGSNKISRVVRSPLEAETMSMIDVYVHDVHKGSDRNKLLNKIGTWKKNSKP